MKEYIFLGVTVVLFLIFLILHIKQNQKNIQIDEQI